MNYLPVSVRSPRALLVFAMSEEADREFDAYRRIVTGVGKVNAASALSSYLASHETPQVVVNLGTSGSKIHPKGTIVNCTGFVQRDMDATAIGYPLYVTPEERNVPVPLHYGLKVSGFLQGVCGSGDSFVADLKRARFDVVEMEAYALALICCRARIPFLCLKYVSDGASATAPEGFEISLDSAPAALYKAFQKSMYQLGKTVFCPYV